MSWSNKCASNTLRNELQALAIPDDPAVPKRRRFFPRSRLLALLDPLDGNREKVEKALRCRCDSCRPYLEAINNHNDPVNHMDVILGDERGSSDSLLVIFALLVYIRCPLLVAGFIEAGAKDGWLYYRTMSPDRVAGDLTVSIWKRYYERDRSGCTGMASEFRDAMFQFAVSKLSMLGYQKFHKDVILPFIDESLVGSVIDQE